MQCSNTLFISNSNNAGNAKSNSDAGVNVQATPEGCSNGTSSGFLPCPDGIGSRNNREKVREKIEEYVLLMLGAPVIKLEIDQQQINLAIDMALKTFEEYAPQEHFQYYVFQTVAGQSIYKLRPDVGVLRQVYYREMANFALTATSLGDYSIPLEFVSGADSNLFGVISPTMPIWGSAGNWTAYKSYENMFAKVSSQLGGYEIIDKDYIKLYPMPCGGQEVIVHYLQKCKDFRDVEIAMMEGALAYAKIMVGRIRSKYASLPGAGGGMQLDGLQILQEGIQDKADWERRLITRFGDVLPIFMQ